MKTINALVLTFTLSACASGSLQREWKARGYSDAEKALIKPHLDGYNRQLSGARSSFFGMVTQHSNIEAQLQNIFCNCQKKLGPKCREKVDTVPEELRQLWAKSNAAEMALKMQHNLDPVAALAGTSSLDADACGG